MYAVVAQQRSGTHFLLSLLNSHSAIATAGEVLHHTTSNHNFYDYWAERVATDPVAIRPSQAVAVWRDFAAQLREELHVPRIVMILMYNQLAALQPRLRDVAFFGQPVIHLVRRNILRTHISDYINRSRIAPTHTREQRAAISISLPTAELLAELRARKTAIDATREQLRTHARTIEVTYEDLVHSRKEALAELIDFIGAADEQLETSLERTNPWPLREMLTNFDEVASLLGSTEFAEMLS